MSIRNVLVLLSREADVAASFALSLAERFGAHVTAAAPVPQPLPDIAFTALPYAVIEASHRDARAVATKHLKDFKAAAARAGVASSIELIDATAEPLFDMISRTARHYDFSVVSQPAPESSTRDLIHEAAENSGRPILVVPHIQTTPAALDTILVAWDESAVAARTVNAALPFLIEAKAVEVVTVTKPHLGERPEGDFDIMRHLARHGVLAELKQLDSSVDIGATLLSHAFDARADLLVMGMYGHARLRESIFGGVTRTILESMTIPVFMAR